MTDVLTLRARAATVLTWLILISLLVLGFWRGNALAYPAMLGSLVGLLLVWDWTAYREVLRKPWAWLLVASFVLLLVASLGVANTPRERFVFVSFIPLLLTIPAAALFVRARFANPATKFASLALLGTVAAVVTCLVRIAISGPGRTGAWQLSPIHFADMAMIAGFMSLAGLFVHGGRWRLIFLLGPVLGLVAGIFAGTRSTVIVGALLLVLALIYWRKSKTIEPRTFVVVAIGLAATIALAVGLAFALGLHRTFGGAGILWQLLLGQGTADMSVHFRFDQYQAALQAIPKAPWFGYGWQHQLSSILPYMSDAGQAQYLVEHWRYVHNEFLSLTVGMGAFGALAYVFLFAYPLVAMWTTTADSQTIPRNYLCLCVLIGIFASGLSDVLFTVELPKTFFCFLPAAIVLLCMDRPEVAS